MVEQEDQPSVSRWVQQNRSAQGAKKGKYERSIEKIKKEPRFSKKFLEKKKGSNDDASRNRMKAQR